MSARHGLPRASAAPDTRRPRPAWRNVAHAARAGAFAGHRRRQHGLAPVIRAARPLPRGTEPPPAEHAVKEPRSTESPCPVTLRRWRTATVAAAHALTATADGNESRCRYRCARIMIPANMRAVYPRTQEDRM